jgi:cell division protein FtsL
MATKKKPTTTTKPAVKKKPTAARKAHKTPVKSKKSTKLSLLGARIKLQPEENEFMTFRVTRQTVYWLVLSLVIILFTLWLTRLQADIQDLYDQIDANTAEMSTL